MVNAIQKTRGLYLIGNKSNNVSKILCEKFFAFIRIRTYNLRHYSIMPPRYPLHHGCMCCEIKKIIIVKKQYICQTNLKMKNSRLFTELFRWTKRCAGKLPAYGGKNKSGLMAEKKPAYGRIKKYGQLLL